MAARDLDPAEIAALLADPDAPFSARQSTLIKNSRTSTVAETTMLVGGRPTTVVYKRFNRKKWIDPWLNLFRPSRAWRSWQAGQDLVSRGIPTPRNLAVPGPHAALLVQPVLPGSCPTRPTWSRCKQEHVVTLAQYVRRRLPALDPEARRDQVRKINQALARLLRQLHDRSLSHRDLKASNILVHLDALETGEFLSLIDLVGVRLMEPGALWAADPEPGPAEHQPGRRAGPHPDRDACGSSAAISPGDCLRSPNWKQVWRSTEKAILAKQARNRRRGRPLS